MGVPQRHFQGQGQIALVRGQRSRLKLQGNHHVKIAQIQEISFFRRLSAKHEIRVTQGGAQ